MSMFIGAGVDIMLGISGTGRPASKLVRMRLCGLVSGGSA